MQGFDQVRRSLQDELKAMEMQGEQLLERILNAESESLVPVYEKRLSVLEERKLELAERAKQDQRQIPTFRERARNAMQFLANPYEHWENGAIDDRRNVLKLTFATRLAYKRGEGYRIPQIALPFKALEDLSAVGNGMVELRGGPSNAQTAARLVMPSDGLEQWPPGEGADIAPESPDGLEDCEKLVGLEGLEPPTKRL